MVSSPRVFTLNGLRIQQVIAIAKDFCLIFQTVILIFLTGILIFQTSAIDLSENNELVRCVRLS